MTLPEIRKLSENKIRLICLIISLAGFIINSITYYPGFLSPDSIAQYTQALDESYGDWHPIFMSIFWHWLLYLYNGPEILLFVHLILLWGSFYLLLSLFVKRYLPLAFLALIFILAPFIQNFAGVIWKDVGMAFSWLLACLIMFNSFYEKRKMTKLEAFTSILLLSYGCWIRLNALPGVIPLLLFWVQLNYNFEKGILSKKALFIKTCGLVIAILSIQIVVTKVIVKPRKEYAEYKLFMHDLTGIYLKTGESCFPDFIKSYPNFDTLYLKKNYHCFTFDNIWWNMDGKKILPFMDDSRIDELKNMWIRTILKHPIIYFKNRFEGFIYFLRIKDSGSSFSPSYAQIDNNKFGIVFKPNVLSSFIFNAIENRKHMIYMKPWFWLFLNLILIVIAFSKKIRTIKPIILVLSLSSLLYILFEFFVFQTDTDFRYFYWNCISLSLAFILFIGESVVNIKNNFYNLDANR